MNEPDAPAELTPEEQQQAAEVAAVIMEALAEGTRAYNHARRAKLIKASLTASNLAILLQLAADAVGLEARDAARTPPLS